MPSASSSVVGGNGESGESGPQGRPKKK